MAISISNVLDVLGAHNIRPTEDDWREDDWEEEDRDDGDLPGIGSIEEGETVYATSLDEVFGGENSPVTSTFLKIRDCASGGSRSNG